MSNKYIIIGLQNMVKNIQYSAGTITYKQGTNASLAIRLKSDATTVIPLTGYSATLEVQKDYAARVNDCIINATIVNNANGDLLLFTFVPSSLSGVRFNTEATDRVYQIKITTSAGEVSIPVQGTFILIKDLS